MSVRKNLIVAGLALGAVLGAGVANAQGRDDVQWSVTIGTPVYSQPAPVYMPAPVYRHHTPVYVQPAPAYHQPTRWDRDGDGIPNRRDRVYNPRWDVDGDGIPNRYDRVNTPRWDRDGDGIPNRHDRWDNNRRYPHGR
jgi:hypothetical protein